MNHDYFRCFTCSERPCDPANCSCYIVTASDGSEERQDDPQWILILMISLLGLQIVEVLIDLAKLWLG